MVHLLFAALLATAPPAVDLSKVDRTLVKEPAYQGKPQYCLLVFGPEARYRAWLVLDGETLYADLDGSGDLTKPGCKVAQTKDEFDRPVFKVPELKLGGERYTDLEVHATPAKEFTRA